MRDARGAIIAVYESEGDPPLGRQSTVLALSSSKVHLPALKSSMAWSNADCCFRRHRCDQPDKLLCLLNLHHSSPPSCQRRARVQYVDKFMLLGDWATRPSISVAWSSRGASGHVPPGALRVSTSSVDCLK